MENIINNLESKYLKFKLGEEQRDVLLSIFSFINNPDERQLTLCGKAGTGKTSILLLVVEYLKLLGLPYQLVAPTHKAKQVLSKSTDNDVMTVHQLLALKANINILDLDLNDLKFDSTYIDSIPVNGVLIIDECSMINDDLYDKLIESCTSKNCKIIACGDTRQLSPVKQTSLAKLFSIDNVYELSTVYRQSNDNPLLDLLTELRKKVVYTFSPFTSENGSLTTYSNWKLFLNNNINEFKDSVKNSNPNAIKLLAYTNARVEAFNKQIRNHLFDTPDEYEVGDFITAYDNCSFDNGVVSGNLINSNDYQIKYSAKIKTEVSGISVLGWKLELYDFELNLTQKVFVLSSDNPQEVFDSLSTKLENLRINAIKSSSSNKKLAWRKYFELNSQFLTPFDLVYNGRLIKKKSLDYGYAMTTHKSQGSTYDKVLVDMGNILKCHDKSELRQLQYTAVSRTKKDVEMLI